MAMKTLQCSGLRGIAAPCTQFHGQQQQQQHRTRAPLLVRASEAEGSTAPQEDSSDPKGSDAPPAPVYDRAFPKRGLFSLADPRQEVYSKAGEAFDPTKKGGRYKPEFIWQTNWQEQLKRQEDLERQQAEYRAQQAAAAAPGGLTGSTGPGVVSLSRLGALEDLSLDLTPQLLQAKQQQSQQGAQAAAAPRRQQQPGASSSSSSSSRSRSSARATAVGGAGGGAQARGQPTAASPSYQFKDLPTQNEARRFRRSGRAAAVGTVATISAVGQPSAEESAARAAAVAAERARYETLKVEFQGWTLGLGLLGGAACYALYGQEVAISYALGASAGLTYLRLLVRSVDAVGEQGVQGGLNSAIGQPRLLVPVVLALTYNRWNALYAGDFGLTLNFYAMLVGFFTYKLAVVGRQGLALLAEISAAPPVYGASSSGAEGEEGGSGSSGSDAGDAMSLDRIFVRRVMSE